MTKAARPFLAKRISALQDLLSEHKLDGYLLTNLAERYYFTDYKSEGYYALVGAKESWLLLPNLLFEQGKAMTHGFTCLQGPFFKVLDGILKDNKLKAVGFDPNQMPYAFGQELVKRGFRAVPGLVAKLRAVKDAFEIKRLRAANHLAARGAEFVRRRLKPGLTEKRAAADLAHFFEIEGDGIAFDLIVAAGAHGAFPHHIPTDYKMKAGDPVICDIGATWEGYRSDLTRTFPLGRITPAFSKVFGIVKKSQEEGIRQIRPGVTAGHIDGVCRKAIEAQGFGDKFVHSTGHGVGIDIHENPRLGPGSQEVLAAGMVITVEPGIYLPGKFGVRIEDTLLVTPKGADILTQ